jgi:carboxyl-terminal processing protease
MRQCLLTLALAGALCVFAVAGSTTPTPETTPPVAAPDPAATPEVGAIPPAQPIAELPRHETISKVMTSLVERSHYSRVKIDDSVSSKMLDSYIEALDGNKLYFLADDIASFERYRYTLDEAVRSGHVEPAFEIFKVYRKRVEDRIAYALSQLKTEPNFTIDESFMFDRQDQPWAVSTKELDEIWRQRVKNDALSLALAGKPWEEIEPLLNKRYERVLKRTHQLTSDEAFETFMNSYADTLDPHSNYFSPRNSEEYRIQMSLSYEGIGASLQLTDDYVTVLDEIPGGPAAVTGTIAPNDRITAVGQGAQKDLTDVIGWRLDDVVQLIRGPGGSTVRLQVLPAGAAPGSPERIVDLTRDKIKLEAQAAKDQRLEVERGGRKLGIGVIDVPSFYQDYNARAAGAKDYVSTTADVRRLITELQGKGLDGLIIDLRGNGGGHLWEARALTGLFVDGPVVQFREAKGPVQELDDLMPGVYYKGPLVVLVDRFSASASEIFAAAIQDYGRGLIVGQQTFGKGTVQNLYDLDHATQSSDMGQLTLTVGKYYRVTGGSTQLRGVHPNIELPPLIDAAEVGESTRNTALPWDEIPAVEYSGSHSLDEEIAPLVAFHDGRASDSPDFDYLKGTIAVTDSERARKSVSLNLAKRKAEREQDRAERLALENQRRKAHDLPPLASAEDLDKEDAPDILLHEAAEIVADLASLDAKAATAADRRPAS